MAPWTVLAGVTAVFVINFAPEYSVQSSYFLTSTVLVLIAWVTQFIYSAVLYPTYLTPHRQLPTPPHRSWFFGNTNSADLRFPVEEAKEWFKTIPNNGLLRYYVIGNKERVLLTSPKAISDLLVTKSYDFKRPNIARIQLEEFTGEGLLIAEGDVHKAQRKNLMPSFSHRHIKDLYPVFWSKAMQMTNEIENEIKSSGSGETTVEIRRWVSRAMLDIIGLAGIDANFNSLGDPDNALALRYESFFRTPVGLQRFIAVICLFFIGFEWYYFFPTRQNKVIHEGVKYIRNYTYEIVNKKRIEVQDEKEKGIDAAKSKNVDILSVAMHSGGFTDDNLVDQMMTFLAAGHETTSSAFQWAIYGLSKYPHVQTRLRAELRKAIPHIPFDQLKDIRDIKDEDGNVKEVFADVFASVDTNSSSNIPYLWAVINEVLRFYPSVPFTSREAARDTVIGGHPIPKGTHILIAAEVTNKDKDLWGADADKFDPDRWLNCTDRLAPLSYNNSGGSSSNYANLTFIHGPRSCIGQGFAKAELAIFVAVFVHRFQFEFADPSKKLQIRRLITQAPNDGVVVKIRDV